MPAQSMLIATTTTVIIITRKVVSLSGRRDGGNVHLRHLSGIAKNFAYFRRHSAVKFTFIADI